MPGKTFLRALILVVCLSLLWGGVSVTQAAGETFEVISVNTTGCASGQFGMTVERANLDGGSYRVRTVVTVGGLIYMNESASISINGLSGWDIYDNFTYGPVPNPGTYPIPANQEMRLDFTLERPVGTVLYAWTLIVDGCNTGNIIYNGASSDASQAGCDMMMYIPPNAVGARIMETTPVYWAPGKVSDEVFPAGMSLRALGVDATGQYTKVLFVCGYYWVPTSVVGPNYDPVWNGAPLPTDVVE